MTELEQLREQKREIEKRISELKNQQILIGGVRLTRPYSRFRLAIRTDVVDKRWICVRNSEDLESTNQYITVLISDLSKMQEEIMARIAIDAERPI